MQKNDTQNRLKALIVVDVQNDFLPQGALPVKHGDQIIPVINQLLQQDFDVKIATKDWHPQDHTSFAVNQGKQPGDTMEIEGIKQTLWPVHCVQNSAGADFPSTLDTKTFEKVFHKGMEKNIDGYSAFYDAGDGRSTGLAEYLNKKGVTDLYFVGLATDYCVKFSVLDAAKLGFNTYVIMEGCRAINLHPNDEANTIQEMHQAGVHIL
jgi:nicotinamidase/pyrazinamidase